MTVSTDNLRAAQETVVVGRGEKFGKTLVLDAGNSVDSCLHIVMEEDSLLDLSVIVLPGANCTADFKVDMEGSGAEAFISGIYLCSSDEKVNIRTEVNHKVHHCISRQLFKGIAGGTARTDFYGKIVVAQDAQKTEAYQENHNLIISRTARMDTKPQLEIYADDVKCTHGATIGRLNEEEQFYMRSRGIPENEARILQMISFISPVISHIPDEEVRGRLASIAEDAVRNMTK